MSRNTCRHHGFSLIETIVVVSLITAIGAISAVVSFGSIGRGSVHEERDLLLTLLLEARTRALANLRETSHGIHLATDAYTVFEGPVFVAGNPLNQRIERTDTISLTPVDTDIVFAPITANAENATIVLANDSASSTVSVYENGRINW